MNRLASFARLLALGAAFLAPPAALVLPVATTGCNLGGCECFWEGGQTFHVNAATRDGSTVYLDLSVNGQPCCASEWDEDEIVRVNLEGYVTGDLQAQATGAVAGTALAVDASGEIALADLGLIIQPADDALSVLDSPVPAFQIVSADGRAALGKIFVPGGPAIH